MIALTLIALGVCWVLWRAFSPALSEREVARIRSDCAADYAREDAAMGRDVEGWSQRQGRR